MRITIVLPPVGFSGGIRVIVMHARWLAGQGHAVTIVHPPNRKPAFRHRVRGLLRGEGWAHVPHVSPSHLDGVPIARRVLDVWRPVVASDVPDADVVIATWWETAEWVAALPPEKGPKVYFIQGFETHEGQPVERVKQTWALPMHKIVVSRWLAGIARDDYGDPDVSLVPNSVDLDRMQAPKRGKQTVPTVGFLYSFLECKGCDIAARAVEIARKTVPDLRVVAFGATDPSPAVPLPPDTAYQRLPAQTDIPGIYASCDAWLAPSRTEGFGLPILEAMACRTPVIATPAGAAAELLAGGGGILVQPEDPGAMAAAIVRVCHMSEAAWQDLSDCARETATAYTWDDASERFEKALEYALSLSGRPAQYPTQDTTARRGLT